uniref:cytochrome P450 76T24-like isoform X3 n=1 Tax=Erigeron canadensis TaxID=72917 RepID=UPI001CB9D03E|nr:cytochrome P450 76T24-like isoform X3 [Erigeron canadensis]
MDYPTFMLLLSVFLISIYVYTISGCRNSRLPPGPYPFPIIGNLLQLGNKPHRSLATLSKCYGPLMSLKLGCKTTIVVSSPDVAKELFHTNDLLFSSRSLPTTSRLMDHYKYSMAWLPVGEQWRRLRRITREYLFSGQCLDDTQQLHMEKVHELLDHVSQCCIDEKAVNIGAIAFTTVVNILSNLLFSKDLCQYVSTESQEFKDAIWSLMEVGGKPNMADFFPILRPLDPQGLTRKGKVYFQKLYGIFDGIIDQRLKARASSSLKAVKTTKGDVLDSLLNLIHLEDESEFSRSDLSHLLLDLFVAGADTTSTTFEWAMTELIRNPKKMQTSRLEITKLMENKKKHIQEKDMSQLPYLQAITKETLRLYPPAPFLVPHEATNDVEVRGFVVPKNAQILCNVWAIGRDPNIWSDPETFMPERFLKVDIDYRGQNFELIPFGSGRRMCPRLNIAHRMLHVMLGSLIQKFDWKLEGNMKVEDMNMEEKFGLTCPRIVPLMLVPIQL